MERDMTARFLCVLYYRTVNSQQVEKSGMAADAIWHIMGYKAFGGEDERQVIEKLVYNNIKNGHIKTVKSTMKLKLTERGKNYGSRVCPRIAGVI